MSRPIAYNASGPLSGSIRGGSVNYTVDSGNRDYTTFASKKWVPSADGAAPIVFVTDTYTQGFQGNPSLAVPLFYSCNGTGSAAIIYTANRIPGSPGNYTDANVALNDLITARGYFILESNDPYQGVDADSLTLDVDAAKMSSYPQVGTNWRDLSGNGITNALTNGPTWNSNGWFTFDGTDDYGVNTDSLLNITGNVTMNTWIRHSGAGSIYGNYAAKDGNTGYRMRRNGPNGSALWMYASGNYIDGGAIYDNLWYMITSVFSSTGLRAYINGNLVASNSAPYPSTPGGPFYIGAVFAGSELFGGDMMGLQVYNKALTQSDIKQNYFGAPIVTDGLVFAVDANNIVSYPKSGTSWYNLTGSGATGTLTNGPTFSPLNGGSIVFDGVDDYVTFSTVTNAVYTINFWYQMGGDDGSYGYFASAGDGKGLAISEGGTINGLVYGQFYYYDGSGVNNLSNIPSTVGWNNICVIINTTTSNIQIYGNSVLLTNTTVSNMSTQITDIGRYTLGGNFLKGKLANYKIYNRALTAAEIQQNYQAEQYRFEGPAGPVTNGLVLYWDAGNLDSYPGTGTTIYDLSGNGNNGTLINGVGYNQTNGGVLITDGIDDVIRLLAPDLRSTNNTVMGAARYTGGPGGRMINSYGNNWLMGQWATTTENYYAEGWVSTPGSGISDANWRIYSALGDVSGDSYSLYINNTLSAGPNNGGSAGPYGISIGAQGGGPGSEPSAGQFSFVLVYNRVLTAAEMTQNYNYFKGRFGL